MLAKDQVFDSSLWQESEQLYSLMQSTCMTLHDEYGLAVNLLLLAMTLDNRAVSLGADCWQRLQNELSGWQERILVPYRKLRQLSEPQVEAQEYRRMLDVEMALERNSQRLILTKLNGEAPQSQQQDPHWNLNCYLSMFNLDAQQFPELIEQQR